jgi:Ni/Fe-hydrogenase subunit HybB-like protein
MNRVKTFKSILWALTGLAVAFGITRMVFGLGSISNLSDSTPWGIWKGLNVIPGIALAGGGFVMTAVIYIMRRQEYKRYSKITVLLAFLGYITAATALVVELGLPWMVWKPIIYWQHHSALFEICWCVILYLTVLFLEFIPVPMEETERFARLRIFLNKYKIVLVFLGIMISTLHQSSLGTLFLITPDKLHPLWYSSLLPVLFFISAVAVGPLMLVLAVLTISYLYRKPLEKDKMANLSFAFMLILAIYGLVRFIDLAVTGKLPIAFNGSWQAWVFWIEITLLLIIPISLLSFRRLRNSTTVLWITTISAVMGVGLDRANIAGIMLIRTGPAYVPTIYEISISLGIISGAILVFLFCVERFNIWEVKWEDPLQKPEAPPRFSRPADVWLGTPRIAGRTIYSLVFVLALASGFMLVSTERIKSAGIEKVPAYRARGGDSLFIDGNHDGYGTLFAHEDHVRRLGEKESCALCHHMNIPLDKQSGCYECHRNMYTTADAFRHDWHASPAGANLTCVECHQSGMQRTATSTKPCDDCHKDLIPENAVIKVDQYDALSYTDAMHGVCVSCHQQKSKTDADKEDLARCPTCHKAREMEYLPPEIRMQFMDTTFNHVVTPVSELVDRIKLEADRDD